MKFYGKASSTERWFRIHPNMRKRWIRERARASVLARIAKRPAPKQVVQNPSLYAEEVDSLGVG